MTRADHVVSTPGRIQTQLDRLLEFVTAEPVPTKTRTLVVQEHHRFVDTEGPLIKGLLRRLRRRSADQMFVEQDALALLKGWEVTRQPGDRRRYHNPRIALYAARRRQRVREGLASTNPAIRAAAQAYMMAGDEQFLQTTEAHDRRILAAHGELHNRLPIERQTRGWAPVPSPTVPPADDPDTDLVTVGGSEASA